MLFFIILEMSEAELIRDRRHSVSSPSSHTVTEAMLGYHASHVTRGKSWYRRNADADYSIRVTIEIENVSKWTLGSPQTFGHGGYISVAPRQVAPNFNELMIARKTGHTATGSYGTVSWEVQGRLVIVMWTEPYNFNHYTNVLAIGMIQPWEHTDDTYDNIYYGKKSYQHMAKGSFYGTTSNLFVCDDLICMSGTMGTAHKPTVVVIVGPASDKNFALIEHQASCGQKVWSSVHLIMLLLFIIAK